VEEVHCEGEAEGGGGEEEEVFEEEEEDQRMRPLMPLPLQVNAIILPARLYLSFRPGRIVERLVESDKEQRQWSLTFSNCEFGGDFFGALFDTLRRCPQISCLNFCSHRTVDVDALLGHRLGQVPPTVKYLNFHKTISKESVRALCALLHRSHMADLPSTASTADTPNGSGKKERGDSIGVVKEKSWKDRTNSGLQGLALTHLSLDHAEIVSILSLLEVHDVKKPSKSGLPRTPIAAIRTAATALLTGSDPSTPKSPVAQQVCTYR
jgi:hypothetical protein